MCVCVRVCELLSHMTLCNPMDYSSPDSSDHGFLSRQEYWSRQSLLQGIFPIQGLNPGLLHCRQILYHLNHQECPVIGVYGYSERNVKVKQKLLSYLFFYFFP